VKSLTVTVEGVTTRSPVWVGRGLLASLPSLVNLSSHTKIVVIGDSGAEKITQTVCQALQVSQDRGRTIKGGESCKRVEELQNIWEFFTSHRLDRRSLVLAVGGGAISDLVGFAAATYMRGIAYIPVPTTLLAQVDASIGGKSGINFGGAKNILGVIRQPSGIVVDVDALTTLPTRDFRSGFAEIVKHGLIIDRSYFDHVTSRDCTTWSADDLVNIIFRSCEIKRDIVEADESEQGVRKTLNFGHTLGHAIEAHAMANGVSVTHGEAVSIGMTAASFISQRQGLLATADQQVIIDRLTTVGLPIQLPEAMDAETLLDLISLDKKNVGGKTRWTLLEGLGKAVHDQDVSDELIIEAIASIQPKYST
jgi:3-dehydroquinate synthase